MNQLLALLSQLKERRVWHEMYYCRDEAVTILVALPGERWEIDVFANGIVEIERFKSTGEIADSSALAELFARHAADA